MNTGQRSSRNHRIVMLLMAAAVLVPSLLGFGNKFLEFITLYRGDVDGAFAISPILNYLLASLGFLFLFGWAALGGMFHNIEQPKYTMLENENFLDQGERKSPKIVNGQPDFGRAVPRHTTAPSPRYGDDHEHN